MFTKRMAGSLMVFSMGLISAEMRIADAFKCRWSISDWDWMEALPVRRRRRCARRRRILDAEVSGMRMRRRMSMGAAIQTISQRDQRQLLAETANPAIKGPRAGPELFFDSFDRIRPLCEVMSI